jgi:hypothetical protein
MPRRFDVANSESLSDEDKELIMGRLGNRISGDGVLRVGLQSTRSRLPNREAAIERFAELMQAALKRLPIGIKTRVSSAAKERALDEKRRSLPKGARSKRATHDDRKYPINLPSVQIPLTGSIVRIPVEQVLKEDWDNIRAFLHPGNSGTFLVSTFYRR